MGCMFVAIFGVIVLGFFGAVGVGLYYLLRLALRERDRDRNQ